jgi:hypothetical protein
LSIGNGLISMAAGGAVAGALVEPEGAIAGAVLGILVGIVIEAIRRDAHRSEHP